MKLPKFTEENRNTNPIPPWMGEMDENDFISCNTGFTRGSHCDLFDEYFYPCEEKGDIRYFIYNPIKHGAPADRKYPAMMWIHGLNCSASGRRCVGSAGGEQFASEQNQAAMGGAFIIVPLANEKSLEDGTIVGSWDEAYLPYLKAIFDKVCEEYSGNIGWRFIMGASSGGYVTWRMLELYQTYFHGGIPVSSRYLPDTDSLRQLDKAGTHLLVAHSRHDEMTSFSKYIAPREAELHALENCICIFPEWARNEDKGVASVNYGREMGQHCMINQIQANLMYQDGTCQDDQLPEGVTGWIRKVMTAFPC